MQRDGLLLAEAIAAAERAIAVVGDRRVEELERDQLRLDALLWNLTVVGEAISQLSAETTSRHPEVSWRRPVDLRNRIVHGYWSIDVSVLHTTTVIDLPEFVRHLRLARAETDLM